MSQITVLTGERRRSRRDEEKPAILADAFSPGAVVSEIARRHRISTGLIYTWRRWAQAKTAPAFVEAVVTDEPAAASPNDAAVIRIELANARVSITASASPALVGALRALR